MTYRQAVAVAFMRVLLDSKTPGPHGLAYPGPATHYLRIIRAAQGR